MENSHSNKKIRVLIAEDSALIRKLLNNILSADNRFEVVAQAINGEQAVKYAKLFNPDVISMDMIMPVMDGLEATYEIMRNHPVPIVIVSSIYQENEVNMAIQELNAGAVAILPKPLSPSHPNFEASAKKYKSLLRIMSEIKVIKRTNGLKASYSTNTANNIIQKCSYSCEVPKVVSIIAIGASAGGPEAIRIFLEQLDYPLKAPIIIIQHIDPNFTEGFATWLQHYSKGIVKIAESGEKLVNNRVYIAPGGKHLTIIDKSTIKLTTPINSVNKYGHTPSIDVFFESITKDSPKECIAILLSGMGKDGAFQLKKLKDCGAFTLIQNETTSLIFGMPGEAEKLNAECKKLNPQEIALEVNYILNNQK